MGTAGIDRYAMEIAQYKALDAAQYAATIRDLTSSDPKIRDVAKTRLICAHLGMVLCLAKRYAGLYGIPVEDFVGIGNETLVMRVNSFCPDQGILFATYARKIILRRVAASVRQFSVRNRNEEISVEEVGSSERYYDERQYKSLHIVLKTLSQQEQDILYYSFFDEFHPSEKEIARKLSVGRSWLRRKKNAIFTKLRPMLSRIPEKRYVTGGVFESEVNCAENF